MSFCKRVIKQYDDNPQKWKNKDIWVIYEKLCQSYSDDKKPNQSITYGLLALRENDTLDLSIVLAKQYQELKQKSKAIDIILKNLDSTRLSWDLNQKGTLLLELGLFDKALHVLKWAEKDKAVSWVDNGTLAEAMIKNGFYNQARSYLIKDMKNKWDRNLTLKKIFEFDLKYGSNDSAYISYIRLADEKFMNDPVAIKRISLFFKSPLAWWRFTDILKLFLLIASICVVFLIPYLWILPIHFIGNRYKQKGIVFSDTEFRWTLRHFWIAAGLLLVSDLLANLIFDHDSFFGIENDSVVDAVSLDIANLTLFSFCCYLGLTIFLLKKHDLQFIWGNLWSKSRSIFLGIGYALLLKVGLGIFLQIYKMFGINIDSLMPTSSIIDNIVSVNQYYHPILSCLLVAFIVPVYEEIIFRGIFLSASEKYMKFFLANAFQSALFAAVHMDLKLFPFYMLFGYVAGYQKRKSQALATGISMHITNNLMAFLVISTRY
jgi:uncharacterized protein